MSFLEHLLGQKKEPDHIEFTQLLDNCEQLVIIFSENTFKNYEIFNYLSSWRYIFQNFTFILPNFLCSFFEKIDTFPNSNFLQINSEIKPFKKSAIFNFSKNKSINRMLIKCEKSIIIDREDIGNLKFIPSFQSPINILKEFAKFFNLTIIHEKINFNFLREDYKKAHFNFFQNKFLNFTLHINDLSNFKKIEELIITLKQNYPSNIYLTGRILKKHNFINMRNLRDQNLLELYSIAEGSDVFISDNEEVVKIFSDLDVTQLFIDKKQTIKNIRTINPDNIYEVKNMIPEILNKTIKPM
ncbi:MAG: hypothetical protein KAT74_05540 [Candidatus Cloacimonetes bacterium]|nr:hypothetical protein [Candidatus Cloacimonadota bacterium]